MPTIPTKIYLISEDTFFFNIFRDKLKGLDLVILSKTSDNFQTFELIQSSEGIFIYHSKNGKEEINEAKNLGKKIYNLDFMSKDKLEEMIRNHIYCLQFHEIYCDTNFLE